ncbi:hypothetical protein PHET_07157 [Paragonimus heterotremus]|uniref:Uncharacterized protein n=1 Tax=Paragonimus heterotremus TaxID=100268 RepID=A0A8J4SNA4_9TREM|nr:hypothetical protein PHET_07157 [Paragonimus heterotremus]
MPQQTNYYANIFQSEPTCVERARLLVDASLRKHASEPRQPPALSPEPGTVRERVQNVQEHLRGNIDALDYLRGISGLEKPFTHLVEDILRTALVMSQENNVSYPQAVYGHNMNEKVDRCWTYINQLTDTVHWHVQHAVRFHKFHHDMKTAQWELTHLTEQSNKSLKELETAEMLSMEQLEQTDRLIEHLLAKLNQLISTARDLCIQSREVAPLHYRKLLPSGRHSAQVLASMRLPDGSWIHRGDPVKVWSDGLIASQLHHEWQAETEDGLRSATLPSLCLWLTSPESSPGSSVRDERTDYEVKQTATPMEVRGEKRNRLFANNKALAQRFQTDVLTACMDSINDIGRLIFPTYKKYMQYLESIEGEIPVTNLQEMNALTGHMKPLLDYGEPDDLLLFGELSRKPLRVANRDAALSTQELSQLARTLRLWNDLREQLKEAKRTSSMRSVSKEVLGTVPHSTQEARKLRSFDARRLRSTSVDYPSHTTVDLMPNGAVPTDSGCLTEELVTSFAEPAPKTFRVLQNGSTQLLDTSETDETLRSRTERYDRMKRAHSQPVGMAVDTRDLMTQITTPYLPTSVNCPNCSLPYEVGIYDSNLDVSTVERVRSAEPMHFYRTRSPSVSPTRIRTYAGERTPVPSDYSPTLQMRNERRLADSSPILTKLADSTVSSQTERNATRGRRKLFKFGGNRSQSVSAAETTASSGIGSSPDHTMMHEKKESRKQGYPKKQSKTDKIKRPRTPFLQWGKRSKSKVQELRNSGTNTESNTHERTYLKDKHDQHGGESVAQPILRSRSWIQQGTPWGYGPPLHERWHPVVGYMSPPEHRLARVPRVQSHSERVLVRASRPKLVTQSNYFTTSPEGALAITTDFHPYNTIDSGIQTDTDMAAGFSDATIVDQSPTVTVTQTSDGLCYHCHRLRSPPVSCDFALQCGPSEQDDQLHSRSPSRQTPDALMQQLSRPLISSGCQTGEEFLTGLRSRLSTESWDVSCQVGVMQRNRGVSVDFRQLSPQKQVRLPPPGASEELEKVPLNKAMPESTATLLESITRSHPSCFSVECQIGRVLSDTGTGPDMLDAVKILDDNIRDHERGMNEELVEPVIVKSSYEMPRPSQLVGKKLQVGTPWWQESTATIKAPTVSLADAACSPFPETKVDSVEKMTMCERNMFIDHPYVNNTAQTDSTGGLALPQKSTYYSKTVQIQVGFVPQTPDGVISTICTQFDASTRKIPPILCSPLVAHSEASVAKTSASTHIDRRTRSTAQQTSVIMTDPLITTTDIAERVSTGSGPVFLCEQQNVDIQTMVIKQASASTQIGSTIPQPTDKSEIERLFIPSERSLKPVRGDVEPLPTSPITTSELGVQNNFPCPKCKYTSVQMQSIVQTRCKRIQKGSPALFAEDSKKVRDAVYADDDGTQPTSETEVIDDPGVELVKPETKRSKPRKLGKCREHRLVVDIGLHTDELRNRNEKGRNFIKIRKRRGCSHPNFLLRSEEEEGSLVSTTSTMTTTSSDQDVHFTRDPSMRPFDSVRMCLLLNPQQRGTRGRQPKQHHYRQRKRNLLEKQKSWSVDDLRVLGSNGAMQTIQCEKVSSTYLVDRPERKNQRPGRSVVIERESSRTRRQLGERKHTRELCAF